MFSDFSFAYTLLHLDHALTPELYPSLVSKIYWLDTRLTLEIARMELSDEEFLKGLSSVLYLYGDSGSI